MYMAPKPHIETSHKLFVHYLFEANTWMVYLCMHWFTI